MSKTHGPSIITPNAKRRLRANREAALSVPCPEETWALRESSLSKGQFRLLEVLGVIRAVETERVKVASEREDGGGNYLRNRWQTDRDAWDWIIDNLHDKRECPEPDCHATGMRNPRDADGYRCTSDSCDRTLSRAEAEQLL